MKKYYQCRFEQQTPDGVDVITSWVEERAAKVGAMVELKGREGLWCVVTVPKDGVTEHEYYQIIGKGRYKWASLTNA